MNIPFKNLLLLFFAKRNKPETIYLPIKKNVNNIFLLLPEDRDDFENSLIILNYFSSNNSAEKVPAGTNKKKITLFVHSSHLHLIRESYLMQIIEYFDKDKMFEEIPRNYLLSRLKNKEFELMIDLNRSGNLFSTICSSFIKAEHKIGLSKPFSDKFFNIQFVSEINDSYNTYSNLKNCLQKLITL